MEELFPFLNTHQQPKQHIYHIKKRTIT